MIKANAHKYGVSALCKVLNISRSTYYYEAKVKRDETELTAAVIDIFKISRNNYGTRKIKKELAKQDKVISRHRIGRIMKLPSFHRFSDRNNEGRIFKDLVCLYVMGVLLSTAGNYLLILSP